MPGRLWKTDGMRDFFLTRWKLVSPAMGSFVPEVPEYAELNGGGRIWDPASNPIRLTRVSEGEQHWLELRLEYGTLADYALHGTIFLACIVGWEPGKTWAHLAFSALAQLIPLALASASFAYACHRAERALRARGWIGSG